MIRISTILFFISLLMGIDYSSITLLKWAGPEGSRPETYEEWLAENPYSELHIQLDRVVYGDGRAGNVAIFTQQSIAGALTNGIIQLTNNLQSDGYTVYSYQISGGTPETLRTFLQNLYNTYNIEGALFIGNLPVAWFEIANDFNQYGYAQFPIDLYYMDLNGTWLDTMNTGNGRYDGHTSNINPEIYVGRLTPTGIGTDTVVLKNYFRKNNAYRHDTLELQHRALFFCDDDWIFWAPTWAAELSYLYTDTMNYWHAETTRASIYRTKLNTPQAWVSVFAHSSPNLHQFKYNNGGSYDYYYASEYSTQNPPANFYNHFACSFARYTTNGYGGGQSIFNQSYGLAEVGSTKTGSMLEFGYFYQPLAQRKTLGEAFKNWFTYITSDGVSFDELCWHYGMTLLGDPWLKPTGHDVSVAEGTKKRELSNAVLAKGNLVHKEIVLAVDIDKPSRLEIELYDCAGRRVKNLNYNITNSKSLSIFLTDNKGNELPAGVYLLSVHINGEINTAKFIKI